jgi:hypothetical protein
VKASALRKPRLVSDPGSKAAKSLRTCPEGRTFASPNPPKSEGQRASDRTNLVQLSELAPQHLRFEVRRVASGRASWGLERFAEISQRSFDAVSFNDERSQLESATALAALNVNLERAFEKLGPGAIARAMRGRMLAVTMRRVRDGFRWRCWHDERA